ncbi:MAG: leucine-rich repeat protein, partial [Clostridia bacterium]|nr:leucine-rich repeat protein [Clostridia bacterium]
MRRNIVLMILAVIMVISIPLSVSAQVFPLHADPYKGICGDGVNWEFDAGSETLTISGEGSMYDYEKFDSPPWYTYMYSIKKLVISSGVTNIGNYAFSLEKMTDVLIPDTVTSIGYMAFLKCYELNEIVIPDGVESIDECAFFDCRNMTEVTIGKGVKRIEDRAFRCCSSLEKVNVPDIHTWCSIDFGGYSSNPLHTAKKLYVNGELLTRLDIPDEIRTVDEVAFFNCSSLTEVTVPESVESIGEFAFYNCGKLKSITLPYSLRKIGIHAFDGCDVLTDVYYDNDRETWDYIVEKDGSARLLEAGVHFSGHKHVYFPVVTEPTCITAGYTAYYCPCGECYVGDFVENGKHVPGEWETENEPTASGVGSRLRKCALCGEILEREDTPPLFSDVSDGEWFADAAVFCFRNGYMYLTNEKSQTFSPHVVLTRAQMVQ